MQKRLVFRFIDIFLLLMILISSSRYSVTASANHPFETRNVVIFFPVADAFIDQAEPDTNFGLTTTLRVGNSPDRIGLIKFTIADLPEGNIQSAKLQIFLKDTSDSRFFVSKVSNNDWSEDQITFNNSPKIENDIVQSERLSTGEWGEVDLSDFIHAEGTYSIAISSGDKDDDFKFVSREKKEKAPRLEISIGVADPPTLEHPSITITQPPDTTSIPTETESTELLSQPSIQNTEITSTFVPEGEFTQTLFPTQPSLLLPTATSTQPSEAEAIPSEFPTQPSLRPSVLLATQTPLLNAQAAVLQELKFLPIADSYVSSTYPGTNYGKSTVLRVDNSPTTRSYLRFNVSGLGSQTVTRARLVIHANSSSSQGLAVKTVSNTTWVETTIKYNNAPAMGNTLSSVTSVTGGTWIELDVTNLVVMDKIYSFGIITPGSTSINLSSRETGVKSPYLIITLNGVGATSTPTVTMTPLVLSTATSPPAPTATRTPDVFPTSTMTPVFIPTPTPTATFNPSSTPISGVDPVLVGAGDIASCASSGDEATANLLDTIAGTIFTTGDNAYESGLTSEYDNCYNPTWGRFKDRTKPSAGNHDYKTAGASGYYAYFGVAAGDPAKGYYSYDLGDWHIIVLNSEISTSASSAQVTWLRQDLASNTVTCTLAYWHKPRFSSGSTHGSNPGMQPLWQALYDYRADVVLNGHDHNYERFAPQTPAGVADPNGIREFVVGTGGISHYGFGPPLANSEIRNGDTYGVLKLTLHATDYDWEFIPVAGKTFSDNGTASCVS